MRLEIRADMGEGMAREEGEVWDIVALWLLSRSRCEESHSSRRE